MAEELKNLIEKIQEEGVQAAEARAKSIEAEARSRADEIVARAEAQARDIVGRAKEEVAKMEASSEATLKQAGRDLILSLKKEIAAILDKIITAEVHKALTPEEIGTLLTALVKQQGSSADVVISLNKEDAEKLEKGSLATLKGELKRGITLKPSEDIRAGFIISFDAGKSHFDFTDKALAEYLGLHLRPKIAQLLK